MQLTTSLANFLRRIRQNRYMIRNLVVRDIRTRYTGSLLGVFWAFLHPLSQLLVFLFVFSYVLKVRLGSQYGGVNFAIWLMCGLLPWMMFVEIVSRSPSAVLEQASLIKKSVFPSEILLVAHVTTAMVNHVIMFGLVILFVVFEGMGLSWRIFWLPVYLAGISLLALGLGWMLSSLNIFMRDIGQVLGVILNIWFYLTPVVYPIEMVPDSYKRLLAFNPMLYPIEGYRMALLGRGETNLAGLAILFSCGLLVALFGGLLFKRLKPAFPDVL